MPLDPAPDRDPLTVGSFAQSSSGTVTLNPTGTMTYSHNAGFISSGSFTYRASDGSLEGDTATVIVSGTHDALPPLPLETSYTATAFGTSDRCNFEYSIANKNFLYAAMWWPVLPEQTGGHACRFDGALPKPGTLGGWTSQSHAATADAAPTSPSHYGSGWTIDTITVAMVLENHLTALWDGGTTIMTMKDDKDTLGATKRMPDNWEEPMLVHSATHGANRPTLAYDENNEALLKTHFQGYTFTEPYRLSRRPVGLSQVAILA